MVEKMCASFQMVKFNPTVGKSKVSTVANHINMLVLINFIHPSMSKMTKNHQTNNHFCRYTVFNWLFQKNHFIHPSRLFAQGIPMASFFLDAHRRGQKKRGFWSSPIQGYSELLGDRQGPRRPAVHVVCDLEPPVDGATLLTHQEVAKVFKACL